MFLYKTEKINEKCVRVWKENHCNALTGFDIFGRKTFLNKKISFWVWPTRYRKVEYQDKYVMGFVLGMFNNDVNTRVLLPVKNDV